MESEDIESDDSVFPRIGEGFLEERTGDVRVGRVACAKALLMSQRALVDYAVGFFEANRE